MLDPFNVPKEYAEAGLSPEVISRRVQDRVQEMEAVAFDAIENKDQVAPEMAADIAARTDIELPATKLSLKTLVQLTQQLMQHEPAHLCGEVALVPRRENGIQSSMGMGDAERVIEVEVRLLQSRKPSARCRISFPASNADNVIDNLAKASLRVLNPSTLCWYYLYTDRYDDAIRVAKDITHDRALYKDWPQAHRIWGTALQLQNKNGEAIRQYKLAIALDGHYAKAYESWGNALLTMKRPKDAITKYAETAELSRSDESIYYDWGLALYQNGEPHEARAKFQRAVSLDPRDSWAYHNLGVLCESERKFAQAIPFFERAVQLDPNDAENYFRLGVDFEKIKEFDEAISSYEECLDLNPQSKVARERLASLLYKEGDAHHLESSTATAPTKR